MLPPAQDASAFQFTLVSPGGSAVLMQVRAAGYGNMGLCRNHSLLATGEKTPCIGWASLLAPSPLAYVSEMPSCYW
jgi:hypothetical protein